jgi:hypothetical protein
MERTYNIGIFVTEKSDRNLQEYFDKVKSKSRQCGYSTGKSREEAVAIVNSHPNEECVIYCPQTDSYISEHFKENFMNLNDPLGILLFDECQTMLSRIDEGLVFKGGILLTNDGQIKRNVKFKFDEDRFVIGIESL